MHDKERGKINKCIYIRKCIIQLSLKLKGRWNVRDQVVITEINEVMWNNNNNNNNNNKNCRRDKKHCCLMVTELKGDNPLRSFSQ